MTEKQIERIRTKIKKIRATLAAEKRKYGVYDDSQGIRFYPTKLYLEIGDFTGALTYLRWFDKNFPGGGYFPDFLFEWTIILFKTGKPEEAEKKAFETFCSATTLLDEFLGRPITRVDKSEATNPETAQSENYFSYLRSHVELEDFTLWLESFVSSVKFQQFSKAYIEIYEQLENENNIETRDKLLKKEARLRNEALKQ